MRWGRSRKMRWRPLTMARTIDFKGMSIAFHSACNISLQPTLKFGRVLSYILYLYIKTYLNYFIYRIIKYQSE